MNILVVESDPIVSLDLSEIIAERIPSASVVLANSLGAAREHMLKLDMLCAAFLGCPYEDVRASGLHDDLDRAGGQIIVLNESDRPFEVAADNCINVPRPFNSEMIFDILDQICSGQRTFQPEDRAGTPA